MIKKIKEAIKKIRDKKPLILCITNYVTMDLMANGILAIGACPLMIKSLDEVEEMVNISSAVNINIGTLDDQYISLAKKTVSAANEKNKVVILDPVGAGASRIRTEFSMELLDFVDIVRGNASEIMSISGGNGSAKGVENNNNIADAYSLAKQLALKHNLTAVISDEVDYLTNGKLEYHIKYGTEMMKYVTGMGCLLNALIAVFAAVIDDKLEASNLALTYFNLVGEIAVSESRGPGQFRVNFLDQLYLADFDKIEKQYNSKKQ